jgi:isopenicillin N synthase-like dioxygenase
MTNGKGKEGRGIGSHTDYGLLVIAAQDDVGGEQDMPCFLLSTQLTAIQAFLSADPTTRRSLPIGSRARQA